MTREEATIQALRGHIEALEDTIKRQSETIKALEQEPREDTVSRETLKEHLRERLYESALNNTDYKCVASDVFKDIAENRLDIWLSELPSVRPTNTVSEEVYTQEYLARKDAEQKLYELQRKIGRCKDCKYFEYDSVAKVDGIPLIVAHEICSKWGDGCKTKEDGYCFLFEPKGSEDKE